MTQQIHKETHHFQTEVKQLLHLMIHSLYSNKEVVLRELISNASDAADKLRFVALTEASLLDSDSELKIWIDLDQEARCLIIRDNGIGMTRDEVIENLGTIAHSGTANFVKKLTGDAQKDSQLIGQFGVGFYSSFMLADRVTVISRRAGVSEKEAVRWESKGDGEYTVENVEKATRGTDVILHLKEDADEYLDYYKVRATLLKYSDHIALPILMKEPALSKKEGDESQAEKTPEYKVVNKATALWTRARADITDAEYKEFYKSLSYDYEEPWTWIHNQVEGNQQYTTLLYIPKRPPFDLWDRERKSGLKLYIKRVFIMDNAEVLPGYLRFVKGVLDSNDLPLNVSREILQNNRLLESIRAASIKKILGHLEKMAETAPEEYSAFWKAFGNVLKEGPAEDFIHREKIAELLRFATTFRDEETQNVSLADYVSRMKPDQKHIYYLTAENFLAAKNSPHLELFRKKGVEVLLLSDRVDEWLMAYMPEYKGKSFQSVSKGELDIENTEADQEKLKTESKNFESLLKQVKETLGDKVEEVRLTHRLTDSPCCIVSDKDAMSLHLQRMIQQAGQAAPISKPILELNPEHSLIQKLKEESDDAIFADRALLLFEQAVLAEGGHLEDPASFVRRMNRFL